MSDAILGYYAAGLERDRLLQGAGPLELARTQEILVRHLPPAPARVLDVGGGPGTHACWLAQRGYEVHLLDPVPLHVEQAQAALAALPGRPAATARLGDARRLDWPDGSVDVVLLLGPLYHLVARQDRLTALSAARRVLLPGGLLCAAGISRFASLLDGLARDMLRQPAFAAIVSADLADGQHRNPSGEPDWFTTAYFHRPEELAEEAAEVGLEPIETLAVEGPLWLLPDLASRWADAARREELMAAARVVEREPTLLGVSAHLLLVARTPHDPDR